MQRKIIALLGVVFISISVLSVEALAQAKTFPAAGQVFLDADGDGKLSEGEKGIADVVISDGLSVLKTDAEGKFAFDAAIDAEYKEAKTPIITVSTPDGHTNSTPWFLRLSGDKAADGSLLFAMKKQEQKKPFEFVHVTDMHWPRGGELPYASFAKEMKAAGQRFAFTIATGDMGDWPDMATPQAAREQQAGAKALLDALPQPWRMTIGNHEVIYAHSLRKGWTKDHPDYGIGLQWSIYGPTRWSFNYAGVHFVGIDVMERPADDEWNVGAPEAALAWLAKDLAMIPKDMPVYMFGHCFNGNQWDKAMDMARFVGVFYGHHHTDKLTVRNKVPFIESASLGAAFKRGYRIIRVDEKGSFNDTYFATGEEQSMIITKFEVDKESSEFVLDGYVYGMKIDQANVSVKVGDVPATVNVKPPLPLNTHFVASAKLNTLPAGYHKVVAEAVEGDKKVTHEQLLLNMQGLNPPAKDINDMIVGVGIGGVDVPAHVLVNGQVVATIPPTTLRGDTYSVIDVKQTNRFSFKVPADVLKRLNTVEIKGGDNGGKPDNIFPTYLWLERDGTIYRDFRKSGMGRFFVRQGPQYIDIQTPLENAKQFRENLAKETHE